MVSHCSYTNGVLLVDDRRYELTSDFLSVDIWSTFNEPTTITIMNGDKRVKRIVKENRPCQHCGGLPAPVLEDATYRLDIYGLALAVSDGYLRRIS